MHTMFGTEVQIEQQVQRQWVGCEQIFYMLEAAERLGCSAVAEWIRREYKWDVFYTERVIVPHEDLKSFMQQRQEQLHALIPQQDPRHDEFKEQMRTVLDASRRLGCYDAQDIFARRVGWQSY